MIKKVEILWLLNTAKAVESQNKLTQSTEKQTASLKKAEAQAQRNLDKQTAAGAKWANQLARQAVAEEKAREKQMLAAQRAAEKQAALSQRAEAQTQRANEKRIAQEQRMMAKLEAQSRRQTQIEANEQRKQTALAEKARLKQIAQAQRAAQAKQRADERASLAAVRQIERERRARERADAQALRAQERRSRAIWGRSMPEGGRAGVGGVITGIGGAMAGAGAIAGGTLAWLSQLGGESIAAKSGFEGLSKSLGLSTKALQDYMKASMGAVDDTDLMFRTNQAYIQGLRDTTQVTKLWEFATKAGASAGIKAADMFEQLTTSIVTGMPRGLKKWIGDIDTIQDRMSKATKSGIVMTEEMAKSEFIAEVFERIGKSSANMGDMSSNAFIKMQAESAKFNSAIEDIGVKAMPTFNKLLGSATWALEKLNKAMEYYFGDFNKEMEKQKSERESWNKRMESQARSGMVPGSGMQANIEMDWWGMFRNAFTGSGEKNWVYKVEIIDKTDGGIKARASNPETLSDKYN